MGHATLGRIGMYRSMLASYEPAATDYDDDAALHEMTFTSLEQLQDEINDSERCDWNALDQVRGELINRLSDARTALARLFVIAMENAHASSTPKVPTVRGQRVDQQPVSVVLLDFLGECAATDAVLRTYCAGPERMRAAWAEHVGTVAKAYAETNAEDLLRAGWTE
jgi:hypothetical protein